MNKCEYLLPCGYCDKFDKKCTHNEPMTIYVGTENIKQGLDSDTAICNHEWEPLNILNAAGYVYRCKKCGTMKTEPITSMLYEYTSTRGNEDLNKQYSSWNSNCGDPCEHCSNNPKNGGSGICHCILGQMNTIKGTVTKAPIYTSGYINDSTSEEINSILTTNVTTSATVEA